MLMNFKSAFLVRGYYFAYKELVFCLTKFSNKISLPFCHLPFHELYLLLLSFIVKRILKAI